jgi:hypothetical protein
MYGYESPADAIGPEPGRTSPEARADWHTAFAVLGRVDGIDLRGCSDGQLQLRRAAYEREISWAPPYVAEELRLVRLQVRTAYENVVREEQEILAATDPETVRRHEQLAVAWRDMQATATAVVGILGQAHETRREWGTLAEPTRQAALAADQELRRRHPGQALDPLRSAEICVAFDAATRPEAQAHPELIETAAGEVSGRAADPVQEGVPERIARISQNARTAQAKLDELRNTRIPSEDTEVNDLGLAWMLFSSRERGAIVQPARPDIVPASEILRRAKNSRPAVIPEAENA